MACKPYRDYPERAKVSKSGVVHAAFMTTQVRDSKEVPFVRLACSYDLLDMDKLVEKGTSITCKNCMRELGITDGKVYSTRYLLQRLDTDDFYRKTRVWGDWVRDMPNATLYKTRGVAETYGKRVFYYDNSGREITHQEATELHKQGITFKREHKFDDKSYRIVEVELVIRVKS